MSKNYRIATAAMFIIIFCASFLQAGVEPSPFKRRLALNRLEQTIDIIQTQILDKRVMSAYWETANGIISVFQKNHDQLTRRQRMDSFAFRAILYCYDISAWLNTYPDCAESILNILDRISSVALKPQPEPPAISRKGLGLLTRIEAVLLNPQPEPPAREMVVSAIALMDRIASVAFNPQPEPPASVKTLQILDIYDRIASVAFNPQPEPPAVEAMVEMFDVVDMMSDISVQLAN